LGEAPSSSFAGSEPSVKAVVTVEPRWKQELLESEGRAKSKGLEEPSLFKLGGIMEYLFSSQIEDCFTKGRKETFR
jgi:hypothetical protein